MITYKIHTNTSGNILVIKTNSDGTTSSGFAIEGNPVYEEYLKWLAEGNTPEPADQDE